MAGQERRALQKLWNKIKILKLAINLSTLSLHIILIRLVKNAVVYLFVQRNVCDAINIYLKID